MKRTVLITGAALSLILGAAAIAQTTSETVTNPGTPTMQRAEDPANNAGLPGGVQSPTASTPVPTGSTAASTADQPASPDTTTSSTSAGTYGSDASATTSDTSTTSSGAASMAGERG